MPEQTSPPPSSSPFAGLGTDKALLRSMQRPTAPATPAEGTEEVTPARTRQGPTPSSASTASKPASNSASEQARTLARTQSELVEAIRRVVKTRGKEVSYVRLTPAEKGQLADVVYTYTRRGQKTTENEINRIAVNYILEDYKTHREASILARVLEALQA